MGDQSGAGVLLTLSVLLLLTDLDALLETDRWSSENYVQITIYLLE